MRFTLYAAFAIFTSTFVQAAPTAVLDAATLLKNGQDAQKLNAQFKNATAPTSCEGMYHTFRLCRWRLTCLCLKVTKPHASAMPLPNVPMESLTLPAGLVQSLKAVSPSLISKQTGL